MLSVLYLRVPRSRKTAVERAAASAGVRVNAWVSKCLELSATSVYEPKACGCDDRASVSAR